MISKKTATILYIIFTAKLLYDVVTFFVEDHVSLSRFLAKIVVALLLYTIVFLGAKTRKA